MRSGLSIPHVFKYWDRWRHNAQCMTSFFFFKKCEKDVVRIVTFDLIGLLPTNHIILYITMAYGSLWGNGQCQQKNSSKNAKYLKFHCQKVEYTRNGKLRQLSGRFQTLIWRPGETVQNLESPGLSGRIDSPVRSKFRFAGMRLVGRYISLKAIIISGRQEFVL